MRRVVSVLALALAAVIWSLAPAGAAGLSGRFADDDRSIHEPDIEALAAAGITKGCNPPDNTLYCPGRPVTRGEMAAFLHRAFADRLVERAPVGFVDVSGSVFAADIVWLGAVGVTKGCNPPVNDRFCPDDQVTRGQMAAFLVRALGLSEPGRDFVDDDRSIFEQDIERLEAAGITKGCNPPVNDRFCPVDPVLREQMASFLVRAIPLSPRPPEIDLLSGWACSKDGTTCSGSATSPGGRPLGIREGWYQVMPYGEGEEAAFTSSSTRFELRVNGSIVPLAEMPVEVGDGRAVREWAATLTTPEAGTWVIDARWYWQGSLERRTSLTVTVVG